MLLTISLFLLPCLGFSHIYHDDEPSRNKKFSKYWRKLNNMGELEFKKGAKSFGYRTDKIYALRCVGIYCHDLDIEKVTCIPTFESLNYDHLEWECHSEELQEQSHFEFKTLAIQCEEEQPGKVNGKVMVTSCSLEYSLQPTWWHSSHPLIYAFCLVTLLVVTIVVCCPEIVSFWRRRREKKSASKRNGGSPELGSKPNEMSNPV